MSAEGLEAVRLALKQDDELAALLGAADSREDWVRIVTERGFDVTVDDLPTPADRQLSDTELEGAVGGMVLPPTDWGSCSYP